MYVLAFYLLLGYPGPRCDIHVLQEVAILGELMDHRESYIYFHTERDYETDLKAICARQSLYPSDNDRARLPAECFVDDCAARNKAQLEYLQNHQACYLHHDYGPEIRQLKYNAQIYSAIHSAYNYSYITDRRKALDDLRNLVGPEEYYRGCYLP